MMAGCNLVLATDDYATGVAHGCPANTIPLDDGCAVVGPRCDPDVFAPDAAQLCAPIGPPEPCPAGEMARVGQSSCEPVSTECHDDPAPLLESGALLVQPDDCSDRGSPFCTIGAALTAARSGELVVVAAGSYQEILRIERPVRVRGVCAATVTVASPDGRPAFDLGPGASGSELRGLGITGGGVRIGGATEVSLRELWIRDTPGEAIVAASSDARAAGAVATIDRCLIHDTFGGGITAIGYRLEVEDCHLHDVHDDAAGLRFGRGIWLRSAWTPDAPAASLLLDRSIVEDTRDAAIVLERAPARIVDTLVRRVIPSEGRVALGASARAAGIVLEGSPPDEPAATSLIASTLVEGVIETGLSVRAARAVVEESVIRRVVSAAGACAGHGVRATGSALEPTRVTIERSLVEDTEQVGVMALGGEVRLSQSIVRRVAAGACAASASSFGDGVAAYEQPLEGTAAEVMARRTRIEQSARLGAVAFGDATITLSDSLLQGNGATGSAHLLRAVYEADEGIEPGAPKIVLSSTRCGHTDGRLFACPADGGDLNHVDPALYERVRGGALAPRLHASGSASSAGELLPEATVTAWGHDALPHAHYAAGEFILWNAPTSGELRLRLSAPADVDSVAPIEIPDENGATATDVRLATLPVSLLTGPVAASAGMLDPTGAMVLATARGPGAGPPGAVGYSLFPEGDVVYLSGAVVSADPTATGTAVAVNLAPGEITVVAEPLAAAACTAVVDAGEPGSAEVAALPGTLSLARFLCEP